jgi:predicted helicase
VKRDAPILAILGNPPYRRLRAGEVPRLVGPFIGELWDDLRRPVRDAGFGRALNAFPDLYVAFYRWALWRLFDLEGAQKRGVLAFITNRGFLAGRGFGGLRRMLRKRFDRIQVLDLRGDTQGARPATVARDENVFNIEVGVCILVAYATGETAPGTEAAVRYADAWAEGAFTRAEKLRLAEEATTDPARLRWRAVEGRGMDRLKPPGFAGTDWPGVDELLRVRSNGIVTYRDDFAYATTREAMEARIRRWLTLPLEQAREEFGDSAANKTGNALRIPLDPAAFERVSYRPLDVRWLYNKPQYVDRPRLVLQAAWGEANVALFVLEDGTGAGPAAWCHGLKPDQHAFRGSYGGWVFPFRDHGGDGRGHYLAAGLVGGLAASYGHPVEPQAVFDAILALLSAASYTTRFAFDLEDDFPRVPFPADPAAFLGAARIGARLRTLQGFAAAPAPAFCTARIVGQASAPALAVPAPRHAFTAEGVLLLPDGSLRMAGVPERVWRFAVSGYPVLYRWLRARNGEALDSALLRAALDVAGRIREILSLQDEADAVLERALTRSLTRGEIGLPPRDDAALAMTEAGDATG